MSGTVDSYYVVSSPGEKGFTMDKNACYESVESAPKTAAQKDPSSLDSKNFNTLKSTAEKDRSIPKNTAGKDSNKLHLVFFVIVIALLLGTVGACIAFTVEIVKLKSELVASQNDLLSRIENLTNQMNTSTSMAQQGNDGPTGIRK